MISLKEFEGIAGYRWSALIDQAGAVNLSRAAPAGSEQKVAFVKRLLTMTEIPLDGADLFFEKGKVIVRRGGYGLLLLFCDNSLNASMLGFVLSEMERPEEPGAGRNEDPEPSSARLVQTYNETKAEIPEAIIAALYALYIEFLGPLAPALARKECRQAEMDPHHLPTHQWPRLLELLAARISDRGKREAFLDRAVMLKSKF